MKKLLMTLALCAAVAIACAQMTFTVQGPENRYNQIRVVNETSRTDFKCRIIILNEDGSDSSEVYGVYELKEKGDSDSNTKKISKGTKLKIQKPKDFPIELDFMVEYKDYPMFDVVIVHLFDKGSAQYDDFE